MKVTFFSARQNLITLKFEAGMVSLTGIMHRCVFMSSILEIRYLINKGKRGFNFTYHIILSLNIALVSSFSTSFMKFKYDIAKDSINTRTGKPIPAKVTGELDSLISNSQI